MRTQASMLTSSESGPQTTQYKGSEAADAFVPVRGGGETTSAEALLVAAYTLMWLLALVFVLITWKKQNHLDRRLGVLESALRDRSDDGSSDRGIVQ